MESILEAVKTGILVGDGAMGTELMKRGLEAGACGELWNLERRRDVTEVLTAYREAGADTLITNTFGANHWKLATCGLEGRLREINIAGVEAAREAAAAQAWALADMGPTGRLVAPLGTDPQEAFVEIFREQAEALAAAGPDAIILETFTSLEEILAALEAAVSTELPVIASMTYNRDASGGFRTIMGEEIAACVGALKEAGAEVIAANCGTGPGEYVDITAALVAAAGGLPVMVQPNAGVPKLVEGRTVFPLGASEMARFVEPLAAAGARVIGGCCGTTPDHIREIRGAVDGVVSDLEP